MTNAIAVPLRGVIIPAAWDEQGRPTAVSLAAEDQREYRVWSRNAKGRLLLSLLSQRVVVDDYRLRQDDPNQPGVIVVARFRVLHDN